MIRYAITGPTSAGSNEDHTARLLRLAKEWAADGVHFVQLREKHMNAGELTILARKLIAALGPRTRVLVNHRADVALAAGAAGVHLTSGPGELTPAQVCTLFAGAPEPVIGISCHTLDDIARARELGATLALFGPVFEKPLESSSALPGIGLEALRRACIAAGPLPVLALGGITPQNAEACMAAGAAGVAGIRLFADPWTA